MTTERQATPGSRTSEAGASPEPASRSGAGVERGALFDPSDAAFVADPYPAYHRLRAEDPVHRTPLGLWVLTRYVDVATALRDPRFGREGFQKRFAPAAGEPEPGTHRQSMLFRDPPHHTVFVGTYA